MPSATTFVPTGQPDTNLLTIEAVPNKGKGLIVQKSIAPGTLLISEPPLFTTASLSNPATFEKDLGAIVRSLPKEGQRAFLSLHNNFPGPNPFSNIVRSNGYPLGPNSDVGAIFPLIARINHSCRPNAQHAWNESEQRETVYAVRAIQPGEELTLSYSAGGPSAERRAALKQFFGFACACEACSLPADGLRASDERLRRAQRLDEAIGDARRVRLQPEAALADCRDLLRVYEQEDIADLRLPRLYYDAFQICAMHSDRARAAVFADSARRARVRCEGEDSVEAGNLKELQERPEGFENFGATTRWNSSLEDDLTKWNDLERPVDSGSAIWDI
jgi:hypothetical protein